MEAGDRTAFPTFVAVATRWHCSTDDLRWFVLCGDESHDLRESSLPLMPTALLPTTLKLRSACNFTGLAPESWWKMGAAPSGVYRRKFQSHTDRVDKERELHDERLLERRKNTCWLDPICVWPIDQAIESARFYDALLRGEFDYDISAWGDRYVPAIPMGPDMHTKFNYSGGGPTSVRASEPAVDGLFKNDHVQMPFVDYLRLCCRYAGLPGLHDLPRWIHQRGVPARVEHIEQDIRYLTEGLLPF
jgi:hypothetical protein